MLLEKAYLEKTAIQCFNFFRQTRSIHNSEILNDLKFYQKSSTSVPTYLLVLSTLLVT